MDITDFGSSDFKKQGLALFTIRNGNWDKKDKMYCEKIMVADEEQETPMHFHLGKRKTLLTGVEEIWLLNFTWLLMLINYLNRW